MGGSIVRMGILLMFFSIGMFGGCSLVGTGKDTELLKYKKRFANALGIPESKLNRINIGFKSLEGDTIGICHIGLNQIFIDPLYFYTNPLEIDRDALIFHEYVHCYCYYGHSKKTFKDKCPGSLMAPKTTSMKCMKKHWKDYMKEINESCTDTKRLSNLLKLITRQEFGEE